MDSNRLKFELVNFINNRPLCLLSTIVGLKELLLGIGFILGLDEIRQTQLYNNFDTIDPGMAGVATGIIMVLLGLFIAITAVVDKIKLTKYGLRVSAYLWLFSGFMYAMDGSWILALAIAGFFSLIPGYISFYYKYAPLWAAQKRELRKKFSLDSSEESVLSSRHIN